MNAPAPRTTNHATPGRRTAVAVWVGVVILMAIGAALAGWGREYDGFVGGLLTGAGIGIATVGGFALGAVYGRRGAATSDNAPDWLPTRDGPQ